MHGSAEVSSATDGSDDTSSARAYNVPHAALLLDLSERKVWDLIKRKEIDSFKVGRARRVPHEAIVAFIERKKREQANAA